MAPLHRYLPVALRLSGREVVIVGGDAEAAAKVSKLLPLRASVRVISASVTPELALRALQGELCWIPRAYREGDLAGAFLAFVCDLAFAARARREADSSGVLLNVLDREDLSDLIAVAFVDRGGLQVGVHTSGQSAALSRRIRERLEGQFTEGYAELVRTLGELRPRVRDLIASPEARRALWLKTVNQRLLEDVDAGRFSPEELVASVGRSLRAEGGAGSEEARHA